MDSTSIPDGLVDFLRTKRPFFSSFTICDDDYSLELTAEQEVGASVGVLNLTGFPESGLLDARGLVDVELATPDDLPGEVREEMAANPLAGDPQVYRFHAADGRVFRAALTAIQFKFKPWLDLERTQRLRQKNAALGYPAQRLAQTWLRETEDALLGQEVPCNSCLQSFRFTGNYQDCPHCDHSASVLPPANFLLAAFHRHESLLASSGCKPLHPAPAGVIERYRLICYSHWLDHKVVEVERTTTGAALRAKYWNLHYDEWVRVAERPLTAAEWRRLTQLVDLAPFWDLPPHGGNFGFDGGDYLLEGLKEGHYHYVERWCPDADSDDENFAYPVRELLSLANANS